MRQLVDAAEGPGRHIAGDQSPGDRLPAIPPLYCTKKHTAMSKRIDARRPRSNFPPTSKPGERGEGPDYGKIHPRACRREERQNHQGQEAPERPEKKGGGNRSRHQRERRQAPRPVKILAQFIPPTGVGAFSICAENFSKRH